MVTPGTHKLFCMKTVNNLLGKRSTKRRAKKENAVSSPLSPTSPDYPVEEVQMGKKSRRIFVNVDAKDSKGRPKSQSFVSNRIQTTKYTFYTFLFKNLYEQFRSVANFYFLSLVILQAFPEFQVVEVGLTAAPIIIIVVVTGIKDAFEDYRRYKTRPLVNF